jgi:uncharacterized protein
MAVVNRRKAATVAALTAAIASVACDARSAVNHGTGRPILRVAADTNMLSVFASLPQFIIEPADIGESEKRLMALQEGSIDVAVAVADVTYLAFNGYSDQTGALDKIRGIALLHPAAIHLLIGPETDPGRGFRGMRVVLGNPRGGNAALGERLITSMGIAKTEIQGEFVLRDLAVDKLLRGDVDAVIVTGPLPQEPVVRALRGGARLLDIDGPEIDRLRASHYPLLRRMLIPRETYPGQNVPVHTVGVDLLAVCRADLDQNLVYELTRAYFEQTPENIRRQTDPQRAPATVIPLHPGAARYYREREVSR